jgi:hypothetical protein
MIGEEAAVNIDFSDDILDGSVLTYGGTLKKDAAGGSFAPPEPEPEPEPTEKAEA